MKKSLLAFLLLFTFSLTTFAQEEVIQYPELSEELLEMRKIDQKLRIKYGKMLRQGKRGTEKFNKLVHKLINIDRNNAARLQEIIAQYGWPTYDKVGRRASSAAWLIAQHADRNPVFQIYCLPLLKAAVDEGQATPRNYAYLYDRVQLAQGYKQLYATQSTTNSYSKETFFQALEDETNVQERREEMGIDRPIEDYAQSLGFTYSIPSHEEAEQRAQRLADTYGEQILAAQTAMQKGDYQTAADHYIQATYCDGYTQTEDYVATARAISLAQHKEANWGYHFLIKAGLRGWDGIYTVDSEPDFAHLKSASPNNWQDLLQVVDELKKTKN